MKSIIQIMVGVLITFLIVATTFGIILIHDIYMYNKAEPTNN